MNPQGLLSLFSVFSRKALEKLGNHCVFLSWERSEVTENTVLIRKSNKFSTIQSNLMPTSVKESITAFTLPWYF